MDKRKVIFPFVRKRKTARERWLAKRRKQSRQALAGKLVRLAAALSVVLGTLVLSLHVLAGEVARAPKERSAREILQDCLVQAECWERFCPAAAPADNETKPVKPTQNMSGNPAQAMPASPAEDLSEEPTSREWDRLIATAAACVMKAEEEGADGEALLAMERAAEEIRSIAAFVGK